MAIFLEREIENRLFNQLVFYDGASPHSGYIAHPQLLSDDLSKGRLTLNFCSTAHAR